LCSQWTVNITSVGGGKSLGRDCSRAAHVSICHVRSLEKQFTHIDTMTTIIHHHLLIHVDQMLVSRDRKRQRELTYIHLDSILYSCLENQKEIIIILTSWTIMFMYENRTYRYCSLNSYRLLFNFWSLSLADRMSQINLSLDAYTFRQAMV
jgi:hypothetical protein